MLTPRLRVAVVFGGRSPEHDISVLSAKSIMAAMDVSKYSIQPYFIDKCGSWSPRPISPAPQQLTDIDVVFPVLHGNLGEDGAIQGLLELADLPYVGAGILASSMSMNKDITKRICRERGLPIVDYIVLDSRQPNIALACSSLEFPMFVKPASLGSSIGVSKVSSVAELESALTLAGHFDHQILVEACIIGREFECSVLGNTAPLTSIPCEVIPTHAFYDYEAKYTAAKTRIQIPPLLPEARLSEIRRMALECYVALGCAGLSRIDFLLDSTTDRLYINEVNTMPGFTSTSMYPKMWEASGKSYSELIDTLIELAFERQASKKSARTIPPSTDGLSSPLPAS